MAGKSLGRNSGGLGSWYQLSHTEVIEYMYWGVGRNLQTKIPEMNPSSTIAPFFSCKTEKADFSGLQGPRLENKDEIILNLNCILESARFLFLFFKKCLSYLTLDQLN